MILYSLYLLIGFGLLIQGANFLINGSVELAKKYNLSEIMIGLTIVAFGTSAPELSVSIIGVMRGTSSIVIGDIVGSNILNIGFVLGLTALFLPIPVNKQTVRFDLPVCLFISVLFPLLLMNNFFSRWESGIFLLFFIGVMSFWYKNRHAPITEEIKEHKYRTWQMILLILIGIAGLGFGGEMTVKNAVKIAHKLHIPETTIAITVVALGTSLPELVTSIIAIIKKKSDLSLGNIVGSNIFNLLLCLGVSGLIKPFTFNLIENRFTLLSNIVFVMLIFFFLVFGKKLARWNGALLLLLYIVYIIILLYYCKEIVL